jgi:hypothetical protein
MKAHSVVYKNIGRFVSFGLIVIIISSFFMPTEEVGADSAKVFSQISFVPNIETAGADLAHGSHPHAHR